MVEGSLTPEYEERLKAVMSNLLPREARWRYFQKGSGPMFVWTTESFNLRYGGKEQGKYESVVYRPYGPGSRKGQAQRWKRDEATASLHVLRKDAKGRAWRLYGQWLETGRVEA
jgi:hypothetical protein